MEKYEFTGEEKIEFGITFKRIRAKIDIERFGVSVGDNGGWIVSEQNLEDDCDAWISGEARISGQAQISGDAWIFGQARISGQAHISGQAQISGEARIFEQAQIFGDAWIFGQARIFGEARISGDDDLLIVGTIGSRRAYTTFARTETGLHVFCGCFKGTLEDFADKVKMHHSGNDHEKNYLGAIAFAKVKFNVE